MTKLPEQFRKTLTWDRGKGLSAHPQFALVTGTSLFFADPHSPWQRPSNEDSKGLRRQYFPYSTDLSPWSAEDLGGVALALSNRPGKSLGGKTPRRCSRSRHAHFKKTNCCNDRLNSPSTPRPSSPDTARTVTSAPASAARA